MLELEAKAYNSPDFMSRLENALVQHDAGGTWDQLQGSYWQESGSGGIHLFYSLGEGNVPRNTKIARDANGETLCETRGSGGYVVMAPSQSSKPGAGLYVAHGEIGNVAYILPKYRDQLVTALSTLDEKPTKVDITYTPGDVTLDSWRELLIPAGWAELRTVDDKTHWTRPGAKTRGTDAVTNSQGDQTLYVFSTSAEFPAEVHLSFEEAWYILDPVGARLAGVRIGRTPESMVYQVDLGQAVTIQETPGTGQHRWADRFAQLYEGKILWSPGSGWLAWNGQVWDRGNSKGGAIVTAVQMLDDIRRTAQSESRANSTDKMLAADLRHLDTDKGMSGTVSLARTRRGVACADSDLDQNPSLFNTKSGTYDLSRMELRPWSPSDKITHLAGAGIDTNWRESEWSGFLDSILPTDLQYYIQRLFGLALLGEVRESILPVFSGKGQNGKTTLVETVMSAFGSYAVTPHPAMLLRDDIHESHVAKLAGARLAVAQESKAGQAFDAGAIKRLTGGDTLTAKRLYEEPFQIRPSWTLILVTNHKPKTDADDGAVWRRIRAVPFDTQIQQIDAGLPGRLKRNCLPAVLGWCVDGWRGYLADGLSEPPLVADRTAEYRDSNDPVKSFLTDTTKPSDPGYKTGRTTQQQLYSAYRQWCEETGERPLPARRFNESVERKGNSRIKSNGTMTWTTVRLA
jgi:putative DNA primase/helicase